MIPQGLWFEAGRRRWRVRLYKDNRVIHLSYHRTEAAALAALIEAQALQQTIVVPKATSLHSPTEQLEALRNGSVD